MADPSLKLREHVIATLRGGQAHVGFDKAVERLPVALRGKRPRGAAHSPWELVEHVRIALGDILEFTRDAKHVSPPWPKGYWPSSAAPPSSKAWIASCAAVKKDLLAFQALVADEDLDLLAPLPHDPSKTVLREALLAADHTSYHVGELVQLRRLLGAWK